MSLSKMSRESPTFPRSSNSPGCSPPPMSLIEKQKYIANYKFPHCNKTSKYEIVAKIGQGTFGEVFKAREKKKNTKFVAMKKVLMDNEKEGFPITALREIKILEKLKHDNVVNLIETCSTPGTVTNGYKFTLYLIFEFCEHDLAGLLANKTIQFNLSQNKMVMQQLLKGLDYIHSNEILHRDMKPANILITKHGILKLADFGLARAFSIPQNDTKNQYTNRVVTLWYRPPELLLGDNNYGPPVDIWSSGCIMAELWTRAVILPGNTEQEQLTLISKLCGSMNPDVWPGVEQLKHYKNIELTKNDKRTVRQHLGPDVKDPTACDLLDKLLTLSPMKRIDAAAALDHDFFRTDPKPSDLGKMLPQRLHSNFEYLAKQQSTTMNQKPQDSTMMDRIW